jgi:transposase
MAYQMRLNLQAIYRSRSAQTARRRFSNWSRWVERKARKLGALLQPMARVAKTVTNHQEGILAHWQQGLTTALLEGLNSVFSAVKRKARGYRSTVYMITVLYLVAGKLKLPAPLTH